jgi:uncharacterized protein with LGFP repeats
VIGTAVITAPVKRSLRGQRARRAWRAVMVAVVAATAPACGGAGVEVGAGAGDPDGYVQAYQEQGGERGMGLPTGPVSAWAFGCRQLFRGGAEGAGALMQQPCGANRQVFGVTGDFWAFYASHGANAATLFGFPLGRRGFLRGGWRQGFGAGGGESAYFMQRPGGRVHYLRGAILERYLFEHGLEEQLGFPTSDPMAVAGGGVNQQFEHGSLTISDAGSTTWIPRR